MRDWNRIRPFLNKLEILWSREPDLRFGQIICLLRNKMNVYDIFHPEENKWEKAMDELINKEN